MHGQTTINHITTKNMWMRTQIPECLVSTKDNDVRGRKPTKNGENEGDDTSLPQAKRHQHIMGTVQEQTIKTIFLLRPPHTELQSKFAQWVANEGGPGKMHHPLIWWKVCTSPCASTFFPLVSSISTYLGSCKRVPCHHKNGQRLSCCHGDISLSGETFFELMTHLPGHTIVIEGLAHLLLAKKWLQGPGSFGI